jgi:SOS-response transcriptional repressor LexA
VKEFQQTKGVVVLKPKSLNNKHKPIILSDEFMIQGIVVATISNIE